MYMMNTKNTVPNRFKLFFIIIAFFTFSLSQMIGYFINENLALYETYELNAFIHLTHIRNHGGVFGSFHGHGWVFAGISFVILAALCAYLFLGKNIKKYEFICFGFIVGAGCSNIADRFIYGSVIDYINIQGIPYWHYVFNSADTFIHIGVWPMILFSLLEIKEEAKTKS